jgi:PAS domain S-box-containing protein
VASRPSSLQSYLAFATALSHAGTPEDVARALVEEGASALGADVGVLARQADADTLELIAHRGLAAGPPAGARFPITVEGPLGAVLRTGEEYLVETAAEFRARFADTAAYDAAHGAVAALPLKVGERVVGAVAFRFVDERAFPAEERDLLRTLVAQSAQALERATLYERERAAHRRMRVLVELAAVLASAQSLDDVAQAVVSEGMRAFGADTCMLYVAEEAEAAGGAGRGAGRGAARLRLVRERGCAPEVVARIRELDLAAEAGRRLTVEQWIEGSEQYHAAMPDMASIPSTHARAAAFWSLPLVAEGAPVGVLAMGFYRPQRFAPEEREFVRLFGQHCAQAVARAERAARAWRERERIARIFGANLIGTLFWEIGGPVVQANDAFLRSIGYTRAELEAGLIDWRKLTPPEHEAADRAAEKILRATGSHEPYEKEYVHKDGHRVPILVSSAAFFDDPDQGVAFVADLTEVKRAAEAANRAKDEFLAMLGHELRNPLAPITTALELIEHRGAPGMERMERPLGIIRRQVRHLTKMVDDLLEVARIRAGKVRLARQPIEVHELLGRAIETVAPLVEERRHRLVVDAPASGLVVEVEPARMVQVLSNILVNAAKYTDPEGTLRIAARADAGHSVIEISDTGVGIDPALLPRVFELFTQEAQSFDRSRGGLGLGLAIAHMFVALHGGSIQAHSEGKAKGSRFTIRLPLAAPGARVREETAAPRLAERATPAGARRVLVVDDNADAAEMLAELAELRGHVVRLAGDGPAALRVLEEFVPDVALLDLGLPVMDGYELARRIRRLPGLGGIRLIAVTGYGQQSARDQTRAAGFDRHLVKPLQIQDVIQAIEGEPEAV